MLLPDRSLGDTGHVADHDALHVRYNNSVEVLSGLASARPAATTVADGTLYWSTDTQRLSRSDGTVWSDLAAGATDHGALTGLGDDDHPQYATDVDLDSAATALIGAINTHDHAGGDGAQVDHGLLAGLAFDDHTQYLNTARHAAVDAADHGSGGAADGDVLTADGAGGAAWQAAGGGPQGKMLWSPGPHPYRAGAWYPAHDAPSLVAGGQTIGVVVFVGPFHVSQTFNIDRIGFATTGAIGNARLALYQAAADGRPGSLVVESASTAVASGENALTVAPTALSANIFYYLAAQFSAVASVYGYPTAGEWAAVPHAGLFGPRAYLPNATVFLHSQAYGPFPATPTLTTGFFSSARPSLAVRAV